MRKANNFRKMAFSMKMSYFAHILSLFVDIIFTVVITHRGSFILGSDHLILEKLGGGRGDFVCAHVLVLL